MKKQLIILLALFSVSAYTQELKISADKNPAIVGEQIILQYTIDETGDNFISPNFNGLQVLSGPNSSIQSSYTFVNGKKESSIKTTYSYYIKALKEGNYNISPASIVINGNTIISESYQLKVVKKNKRNQDQDKALRNNLFIKVGVSKRNIVIGEQILVTYKLFTRIDLHNTELSSLPELNGFWTKELETSSRFKRDVIDGIPYNVATIKKSVLTAQKSGELIIDPMELKCSIRIQSKRNNRDPFANFFGGGYNVKEEIISSKAIIINVTELPPPPNKYYGAVGQMTISSELDNNTINANEAINYKLKITGKGNIELIEPLDIKFPDDFEVYDPKISLKIFEGGRKRSIKTFEYLLIPRYKGDYSIPSVNLIVYNTKNKQYETTTTDNHKLIVLENKNTESENINTTQEIIKNKQQDINFIATETNLRKKGGSNTLSKNTFKVLFFLPLILLFLLYSYKKIIQRDDIKNRKWKNKKANKIAQKRLKNAQKCIKNNNFDLFFEEIEKSLWGYFADKFHVSIAKLSKDTISSYFNSFSIEQEIKHNFIQLLDECEYARYTPTNNKNAKMDLTLEQAESIIIQVETALK